MLCRLSISTFCDRESVSVTGSLCQSWTVCVCIQRSSWVIPVSNLTNHIWFLSKFVWEIWVCPSTPLVALLLLWTPGPETPQSVDSNQTWPIYWSYWNVNWPKNFQGNLNHTVFPIIDYCTLYAQVYQSIYISYLKFCYSLRLQGFSSHFS